MKQKFKNKEKNLNKRASYSKKDYQFNTIVFKVKFLVYRVL